MAKKWKRSIIRLSIVGVIIALGSVGGIQIQSLLTATDGTEEQSSDDDNDGNKPEGSGGSDDNGNGNDSPKGGLTSPPAVPPGSFVAASSPPPSTPPFSQPPPWNPTGSTEIVRGNGDSEFVPSKSAPTPGSSRRNVPGEFSVPPSQPPTTGSTSTGFTDSFPPAQPPNGSIPNSKGTSLSDDGRFPATSPTPSALAPLRSATPLEISDTGPRTPTIAPSQFGDSRDPLPTVAPTPAKATNAPRFDSRPANGSGDSRSTFSDAGAGGTGFSSNPTTRFPSAPPIGPASSVTSLPESQASPEPGSKELDGLQTPSLTLQKIAPAEIQVGRPAMFQIKVSNVGKADANVVTVIDRIPKGTQFVDASPEPAHNDGQMLIWNLDTIKSGGDTTISIQLIPTTEGEIGSVATVGFQSQASVRTICTKPVLVVEHSAPKEVLIGQSLTLDITVTNRGTGAATGVIVEEEVPEQLAHPAGGELEYQIGTLQPGESKKFQLNLQAKQAGQFENILLVRADGNLLDEDRQPVEVIAPKLNVRLEGPSRRYLERQATYTLSVENPGTAKATNVDLIAHMPKGMKFVRTNNQGQYDPATHAVYWSLAELPPNQAGEVELSAIPIEMGEQKLRIEGRGDLGIADELEQPVLVEGLAAIFFGVVDTADPIEVGSDTVYQVKVVNQGSKTATNVRVEGILPNGLKPIGGDGPTTYQIAEQSIYFEPLARLAPKDQAVFKIQVRGMTDGDHRITVRVATDEVQTPVSKEESTRVYSDR